MSREVVTITHGTGGIRMKCDDIVRCWSNVEMLAESHAEAVLTERARWHEITEIRKTMNDAEKNENVTTGNLIAASGL